jgi:nucleoside-diphosphate-sugar epimerase
MNIFITGASGAIGHYALHALSSAFPKATLHLLVRNVSKFKINVMDWPNVVIHNGDMDAIGKFKEALHETDYLIHIATVWGYNLEDNIRVNKDRTLEMFNYLDPQRIKKIIYFSTASILKAGNKLCEVARTDGIPYIQSKWIAYNAIKSCPWKSKIITLFPTVVLGGGPKSPYSHISKGLHESKKDINWARFLNINVRFHFMHAHDIAQMIIIGMTNNNMPNDIVIGQPVMTLNQAILALCERHKKKAWIQIPISKVVIHLAIRLFRKKLHPWAIHCAKNPIFEYTTHTPNDYGMKSKFPTLTSVLNEMPIKGIAPN